MSNSNTSLTNAQSLVIEKKDFDYITLMNPSVSVGDVLVVLEGTEILFHGMIGRLEDGWATASDPRGSALPTTMA
jgi:hypothetical protein